MTHTVPRRVETPAARNTEPDTSHAAAAAVTASGARYRQQQIVARAVADHPGCTSRELAEHCQLDRYAVARRCPEVELSGQIRRGEPRSCALGGRAATTWWAAPMQPACRPA